MNPIPKYRPSSSILIIFILLMIVGISVLSLLNVQLTPSRSLPGLSISYRWADASARVIEQKVTSKLEGLFSGVRGIKGVSLNDSCKSILYTCLGNNYKALGKHPEAEQAYLHAFIMAPARFYGLYLLAKLYDETGQQEKAIAMAKKVMEKEVKIESTAVKEIQKEMRKIIEKSKAEALDKSKTDNNITPIDMGTKEGAYRSVVLTSKFMLQKW